MSTPVHRVDTRVSVALCEMIRSMPAQGLTLRELLERLGEHGLLILCMILTILFLIPLSIPGSSIPFGVIIALIGGAKVYGKGLHLTMMGDDTADTGACPQSSVGGEGEPS